MVKHERHGVGFREIATGLGEGRAHVRRCAIAVVGQHFGNDCDASRTVTFVADFIEGRAVGCFALLDRALDGILGHVFLARSDDSGAQAWIHCRVRQAHLGRHGDFTPQLAEHFRLDSILLALAAHDVLELGMSGHGISRIGFSTATVVRPRAL